MFLKFLSLLFVSLLIPVTLAYADADLLARDAAQIQADKDLLAKDREILRQASEQLQQDRATMVNHERRPALDIQASTSTKRSFWGKAAPVVTPTAQALPQPQSMAPAALSNEHSTLVPATPTAAVTSPVAKPE